MIQKVNEKLKILERKTFGTNTPVSVAVVGCGYSGVELAATIAERLQNRGIIKAINVGNEIIPDAPPGNRQAAKKVRNLYFEISRLCLGYIHFLYLVLLIKECPCSGKGAPGDRLSPKFDFQFQPPPLYVKINHKCGRDISFCNCKKQSFFT